MQPQQTSDEGDEDGARISAYHRRLISLEMEGGKEKVVKWKQKERDRLQLYRLTLSEEKKAAAREKHRIRQRRYHEKMKMKQTEQPERKRTRQEEAQILAQHEEKKKYWRIKQAESRAKRKKNSTYKRSTQSASKSLSPPSSDSSSQCLPSSSKSLSPSSSPSLSQSSSLLSGGKSKDGFDSFPAKRQALRRVRKVMPQDDTKWASIMKSLISSASPNKKKLLEDQIPRETSCIIKKTSATTIKN